MYNTFMKPIKFYILTIWLYKTHVGEKGRRSGAGEPVKRSTRQFRGQDLELDIGVCNMGDICNPSLV